MAPSDNWSCPICLGRFVRPVLVSCCGQSFCRSCLDDALRQADACPMCRSPLLSGPFSVTSNRALEDALTALDSSSPRRSTTEKRATTSFVDAAERKLTAQMQVSVIATEEFESNEVPDEEEQHSRLRAGYKWDTQHSKLSSWKAVCELTISGAPTKTAAMATVV
ncbi:C3HC4 type (RING finger) zinc finger protein [Phytophthora infestans]|uniref:C3HC4 type (RING finger) zinc finger protein n=1 Tax=Phytophthora infestans TaxID=4787 RepID=A0A833T3I8_PHYIN|nr:C3HC4 type (RING finger) zinc finger protein [Phytophthora infestans]